MPLPKDTDEVKRLKFTLRTALDDLAHIQGEVDLAITNLSMLLDSADTSIHDAPLELQ